MTILAKEAIFKWDQFIPAILFSYRTGICESTGFSPYFLMFGRPPNLPIDLLLGTKHCEYENEASYAADVANALDKAYEYARAKQLQAAVNNATHRDKGRHDPTYKEGDLVFYWYDKTSDSYESTATGETTSIPHKWRNWWQGPYTVTRRLGDHVYELVLNGKTVRANVNRMIRHTAFSTTIKDTSAFDWRALGGTLDFAQGPPVIQGIPTNVKPVTVGDMVAWPLRPTPDSPLPFGVGKVLAVHNDTLNVQWYGNM